MGSVVAWTACVLSDIALSELVPTTSEPDRTGRSRVAEDARPPDAGRLTQSVGPSEVGRSDTGLTVAAV